MKIKVTEITVTDVDKTSIKIREWPDDPSFCVIIDSSDHEVFVIEKEKADVLIDAINKICVD